MNHKLAYVAGMSLCMALSACVDNNYDLSDIDTTVKIPVNSLTIPVNIEPVELENIFNIDPNDPDSRIKVVNGEYAVSQDGHFESKEVEISSIILERPVVSSSTNTISLNPNYTRAANVTTTSYSIASAKRELTFESDFVSNYILDVEGIQCNLSLTLNISFPELSSMVRKFTFNNVDLQLPKGLLGVSIDGAECTYNKETGVLNIPQYPSTHAALQVTIHATGVDMTYLKSVGEASFTPSANDDAQGHIMVHGELYVLSGDALVNSTDIHSPENLPGQATMIVDYTFYDTEVTHFSGRIKYSIGEVDIPEIVLDNLPDILSQETTNLSLENPQIYLTITNPLTSYDLMAESGLRIITNRTDKPSHEFTLDQNLMLSSKDASGGVFQFVLSPKNPETRLSGFENAQWLKFSGLGEVLAGEGLPNTIDIELINPNVPAQDVTDFALGVNIGTVEGDYDLLAPLGMSQGSQIVYSDDMDGWESEDLDHCTIELLSISLTVSTDIPVSVNLSGYPIDIDGNRINDIHGNPVSIDGANIEANAKNKQVNVHTTGVIPPDSKLNGIRFVATAVAPGTDNAALSPDMTITLSNIRATVSGYYIKDLDN